MTNYLYLFVIFVVVFLTYEKQTTDAVVRRIRLRKIGSRRKTNGRTSEMKELAKRFIGEECTIEMINSGLSGGVQGVIREIGENGLLIEKKSGELEIVNLDFVTAIGQSPKKKKDKRK